MHIFWTSYDLDTLFYFCTPPLPLPSCNHWQDRWDMYLSLYFTTRCCNSDLYDNRSLRSTFRRAQCFAELLNKNLRTEHIHEVIYDIRREMKHRTTTVLYSYSIFIYHRISSPQRNSPIEYHVSSFVAFTAILMSSIVIDERSHIPLKMPSVIS